RIAFALAVGGTDMPVLACLCLGFALLWRRPRPVLAGLALGAAAAMKATAWPALLVAAVLLVARDGRRAAVSMAATALVIVAAVVGPVAALGPRSLVQNTIAFPLGLTHVKSDAVSPLPGRLLAETGPTGHLVAVALLALAGRASVASPAGRRAGRYARSWRQPLVGSGLFGPLNAAESLQMFWFALMPWKLLFEFRVATEGPFALGWVPVRPLNFEPRIRLRVPAWRVLTCLTWTPATSFLSVFTAGSWEAE